MKRAPVLGHFIARHTFGLCMTGALLGAIYGFSIMFLAPIVRAITVPDPYFDLRSFMTSVLLGLLVGLGVALISGFLGAIIGMTVGLVNGLLLGLLTILAYYPPKEYRYYSLVTGLISAVAAITTTYALFFYMLPAIRNVAPPQEGNSTLLALLLGTVPISGFGAWWVNRFVARWYQHKLPAPEAEVASPSPSSLL